MQIKLFVRLDSIAHSLTFCCLLDGSGIKINELHSFNFANVSIISWGLISTPLIFFMRKRFGYCSCQAVQQQSAIKYFFKQLIFGFAQHSISSPRIRSDILNNLFLRMPGHSVWHISNTRHSIYRRVSANYIFSLFSPLLYIFFLDFQCLHRAPFLRYSELSGLQLQHFSLIFSLFFFLPSIRKYTQLFFSSLIGITVLLQKSSYFSHL